MIFDRRIIVSFDESSETPWSLFLSFSDGEKDFHEIDCTRITSTPNCSRMDIERAHYICSDAFYAYATMDRRDFPMLLLRLRTEGVERIHAVLQSVPSYRPLESGRGEDFLN